MQRYTNIVRDSNGNPAAGVTCLVLDASTGSVATLYNASENTLSPTGAISNPIVTGANGRVAFAALNGRYNIIYSGGSSASYTESWVTLGDDSGLISATYPVGGEYLALRVNNSNSGRGPNVIHCYDPLFSGTRDPVITFSYNMYAGGNLVQSGEPAFGFNIEGNYNDGSGQNKMEMYAQYISSDGLTSVRPHFIQMNRTTNKIAAHILKGDVIRVLADDAPNEGGSDILQIAKNSILLYAPNASADTYWRANAASGYTAVLSLGRNGSQDVLQIFSTTQTEGLWVQGGRTIAHFFSSGGSGACSTVSIGVQDNNAVLTADVGTSHTSIKGVVARGKSGQTGNLYEAQDSSFNVLWYVSPSGNESIKTVNGAEWIHGQASELLTIAAAASTDTSANLLPANAIIESVVVRVTTVIPTAATFSVGDATTAARFATGVSTAATTTAVGLTHCDQTGAAGPKQTAAAKIRITPNATPGAATGVVRITVFYRQFIAPTS